MAPHRRISVRDAFLHAWRGYERHAWGTDELQPISRVGRNTFGGLGLTILGTKFVKDDLDFDNADSDVSVFELTIRGLGGLLGAHTLSGKEIFLERAQELGQRLLPAFQSPSRIPWPTVNLARGTSKKSTQPVILSEAGTIFDRAIQKFIVKSFVRMACMLGVFGVKVGSLQVEFRSLTARTGDSRFQRAADKAFQAVQSVGIRGILPVLSAGAVCQVLSAGERKILFQEKEDFHSKVKEEFYSKKKDEKEEFYCKEKEEFDSKEKEEFFSKVKEEFYSKEKKEFYSKSRKNSIPRERRVPFQGQRRILFQGERRVLLQGERRVLFQRERRVLFQEKQEFDSKVKEEFYCKEKEEFYCKEKEGFHSKEKEEFYSKKKWKLENFSSVLREMGCTTSKPAAQPAKKAEPKAEPAPKEEKKEEPKVEEKKPEPVQETKEEPVGEVVDVKKGMGVTNFRRGQSGHVLQHTATDVLVKYEDGKTEWTEIEDLKKMDPCLRWQIHCLYNLMKLLLFVFLSAAVAREVKLPEVKVEGSGDTKGLCSCGFF
eukprot:Skav222590  [mRNA]  locus=scaffold2868:25192:51092:+ [translate_table: standard]